MKSNKLDARTKKQLNLMCERNGYNFPLGDWIDKVNDVLEKLDSDTGVTDQDYSELRSDTE